MKTSKIKLAVVAVVIGGLLFSALKLVGQNIDKTELAILIVSLVVCVVVALRLEQRRKRRQLDLMRDSALW